MSVAFSGILHWRICCTAMAIASLLLLCIGMPAAAQEERPQIPVGERKAPRKKDAGPRAFGVLQLAADGKATLIPIAILIDGKFWDATAYKADPVPMSLDTGVVYEGERSGNSLGLFTVAGALHINTPNGQPPWLGTGSWRPVGTEPASKPAKTEGAPVGIDPGDEPPPRLTRDANATKPSVNGAPPASKTPASTTPQASESGEPSNGDGPPRLKKGEAPASAPPPSGPTSSQGQGSAAPPAPSASGKKDADEKADTRPSVPTSDSGAREGNRPVLRRGKPAQSFADEDVPGYSKPGAAAPSGKDGNVVVASAARSDVQLIPAISDAAVSIPRSFTFEWLKGEEGDRRKQMMDLAKEQVQSYVIARAKAQISAKPVRPTAAQKSAKPPDPIFENVQMIAYDLWNSNQPVILLSAEAHMPPPAAGAPHSDVEAEMKYFVLLVAYPDIYNNLHKLQYSVTDKYHFDVLPRLELIDAVDADGDGRGELLFRKTTDTGTGWVLYRATADKLWKAFDSLNPQ